MRTIASRIIPYAGRFKKDTDKWRWEINLINTKEANAFCMPGGKIVFYTGLLEGLSLTDDEIVIVMGHEIAHALREHARERMAKGKLTEQGVGLLGSKIGGGRYTEAFQAGGGLLNLKFSRDDESEADIVGLDLAARAGYDPRAGVSLWKKWARPTNVPRCNGSLPTLLAQHAFRRLKKNFPWSCPSMSRHANNQLYKAGDTTSK